jgi:hypothetical protein
MNKTKWLMTGLVVLGLTACQTTANQPPLNATIQDKSKEQVLDRIASLCQDYGFFVEDMSQSTVKCQRQSSTTAQVLFGTRSGGGVQSIVQFTALTPSKNTVRVNSRAWLENMNAYGGVKRTPVAPQSVSEIRMIFQDLERY